MRFSVPTSPFRRRCGFELDDILVGIERIDNVPVVLPITPRRNLRVRVTSPSSASNFMQVHKTAYVKFVRQYLIGAYDEVVDKLDHAGLL